jgi:hypothetical protein
MTPDHELRQRILSWWLHRPSRPCVCGPSNPDRRDVIDLNTSPATVAVYCTSCGHLLDTFLLEVIERYLPQPRTGP